MMNSGCEAGWDGLGMLLTVRKLDEWVGGKGFGWAGWCDVKGWAGWMSVSR